ncbi:IS481 family transposase [Streptomyces lydicus]|uniref:IS481 family transposase n=1 Tax=Streptomyces lydicus TaxID=47763 RepID=A0A3Q9K7W7_9ACTN|nr:IS481 family transposase [Streptomyces lydicus]AZS71130.1 IS481 family transposase [Streptomyces lydicus]AZS71626.1 IS481 family transposase [Streptomyces lydicus]AZS75768.1 IS481 family transposase [Streptomyces lydicus]
MTHANARLTFHGRCLLVRRVVHDLRPVAHVAKELGVSRQCAHRWVARFHAEGWNGLHDRSSRPRTCPRRTPEPVEAAVLNARRAHRRGPDFLAAETGVPARTVTRILRRHQIPRLASCDPLTGQPIRAERRSHARYERARPGELVHLDVKKIGRIPDGGGWRAHGRQAGKTYAQKQARIGYDYIHAAVDDHSRLAYAEIHTDEKADTCAGFLTRAAAFFAAHGIDRIERVLTDNAWTYRKSTTFRQAVADLGAEQRFIRPHCPWTNGKVERFNRTLQTEWAYRQVFTSNSERAHALAPWLTFYNTRRRHTALEGQPPISRLSPKS